MCPARMVAVESLISESACCSDMIGVELVLPWMVVSQSMPGMQSSKRSVPCATALMAAPSNWAPKDTSPVPTARLLGWYKIVLTVMKRWSVVSEATSRFEFEAGNGPRPCNLAMLN